MRRSTRAPQSITLELQSGDYITLQNVNYIGEWRRNYTLPLPMVRIKLVAKLIAQTTQQARMFSSLLGMLEENWITVCEHTSTKTKTKTSQLSRGSEGRLCLRQRQIQRQRQVSGKLSRGRQECSLSLRNVWREWNHCVWTYQYHSFPSKTNTNTNPN